MNYYKKLPCNNYTEINKEILNHVLVAIDLEHVKSFWNPIPVVDFVKSTPLFQQWLSQQHLQIRAIAVTVGLFANCCSAHVDTPPAIYKLSWPIQNSETTWNRWFRETALDCDIVINHLGGKQYLNPSQLEEITRQRVDSPMLIHAGVPHDVWFEDDSKFPRLGLQCHLLKEPAEL